MIVNTVLLKFDYLIFLLFIKIMIIILMKIIIKYILILNNHTNLLDYIEFETNMVGLSKERRINYSLNL